MNDWEIKNLQRQLERETKNLQDQLDRLDKKVWKESTTNFIWLMILSNVLFWLFIFNVDLRNDLKIIHLVPQHDQVTSDIQKKKNST